MIPSIVLFFAASVWGLYWLPLRAIEADGLSGPWSVLAINLVPLLVLLPVVAWRRRGVAHAIRPLLLIGFFVGMGWTLYGMGLLYTTIVRATLLFYLTPIWSTLFAMSMLGERAGSIRWIAIVIGFVGLFLMMGLGLASTPLTIGDAFGLISGISWGAGTTYIRKHPEVAPVDSFAAQALGSVVVAGFCILVVPLPDLMTPGLASWRDSAPLVIAVCLLAVIPSSYAIVWAAQRLSPGRVGILMMSEVVVAVVSAALFTEESMGTGEWVGASLIIGAAALEVSTGDGGRDSA